MEVTLLREKETADSIVQELIGDADNAMRVDCADPYVGFTVLGWFIFPKGSLQKNDTSGPS